MLKKISPKIVLALDSFKGSLTSIEAEKAIESGILSVLPDAKVVKIPVADGGEGTVSTLTQATNGTLHKVICHDPLFRKTEAYFGISHDHKTAFIEVAQSSGLTLIEPHLRDVLKASSYGVGEQIKAALELGARDFILCIGGSATSDGGAGLLQALGARFYNNKSEIPAIPQTLINCTDIDLTGLDHRIYDSTFKAACDVDNPLVGPDGAAFTFAPQKGANPEECRLLDEALTNLGKMYENLSKTPILNEPKMGASGGISAALKALFKADLVAGVDLVLDYLDFDKKIEGSQLLITGEGSLDSQSLRGKTPLGVLRRSKKMHIPVVALAGKVETNLRLLQKAGFAAVFSIAPGPITLEESMKNTPELLAFSVGNIVNLIFNAFGENLK